MDDIKKENERSKAFSKEKQNPPINKPQSASHKSEPLQQLHDMKESDKENTGKEVEQIAFPANPFWYDKYGEFFSSSWCPLYGEIPESFEADNLTKQCVRILEESRNIWQCFPQPDISKYSERKLKLAQEMWNLFYTHFTSIFESQTYKDGTVDLECMRIINWTRKIPTLELKELTDFEIVALFAVYVTWRALEDWLTVEKGESVVGLLYPPGDEYIFMKEKIRIAYLVLSEAKRIYTQTQEKINNKVIHIPKQDRKQDTPEPEKQAKSETQITSSTPQAKPVLQAQSLPVKETKKKKIDKLFYTYNNQDKIVLYSKNKNEQVEFTEEETKLFLFLKEDRRKLEEIVEHVWEVYKPKDLSKKKNNAWELRCRLNKKCSKMGVETLISEQINGYYQLTLEIEEH